MLVLILGCREEDSLEALPSSTFELYQMAIYGAIQRRSKVMCDGDADPAAVRKLADRMHAQLEAIAVKNHVTQNREFHTRQIVDILRAPDASELWESLQNSDEGVPLVKTLEIQAASGDEPFLQGLADRLGTIGFYQFKHLSFQEALFASWLQKNAATWADWATDEQAAAFCNNTFYNNCLRICGGQLGELLGKRRPSLVMRQLTDRGVEALQMAFAKNTTLTALSIAGNGGAFTRLEVAGGAAAAGSDGDGADADAALVDITSLMGTILGPRSSLTALDLSDCAISVEALASLFETLHGSRAPLRWLSLKGNVTEALKKPTLTLALALTLTLTLTLTQERDRGSQEAGCHLRQRERGGARGRLQIQGEPRGAGDRHGHPRPHGRLRSHPHTRGHQLGRRAAAAAPLGRLACGQPRRLWAE